MLDFDVNRLVKQLIPSFLRTIIRLKWLAVLFAPIVRIWSSYKEWRILKYYEANVTAQVISIEAYLNKLFDPVKKRIKIVQTVTSNVYIYLRSEGYLDKGINGDKGKVVYMKGEKPETELDGFLVEVPSDINALQVEGVLEKICAVGVSYGIKIV